MNKLRVTIIGGGFAGLSAAKVLSSRRDLVEITLIDQNENMQFRPLLPDIVSKNVKINDILYSYSKLKEKYGFTFYHEPVRALNFNQNQINVSEQNLDYDYLIIAAGSQSAPLPVENLKHSTLKFNTAYDANIIRDLVFQGKYERIIICGGGYTGVELASNIQKAILKSNSKTETIVVEMTNSLVGTLPVWMQRYIKKNLEKMGIIVQLSSKIETINSKTVILSTGQKYENALCIWTTGLVSASITSNLNIEKGPKGRIMVDSALMFRENCFAAGDISCLKNLKYNPRLSVQAAVDQGRICGKNILQSITGSSLFKYSPRDPCFIIPTADGNSCGEVLGFPVKGKIASLLHYIISTYRSYGFANKINILTGAKVIC
ncbi:MAG: FAD-dependent oxidoreductase [Fibrobacter sp.]|nr:FAD-dependent oxidoreductase [Fibrobacter sp.]